MPIEEISEVIISVPYKSFSIDGASIPKKEGLTVYKVLCIEPGVHTFEGLMKVYVPVKEVTGISINANNGKRTMAYKTKLVRSWKNVTHTFIAKAGKSYPIHILLSNRMCEENNLQCSGAITPTDISDCI